MALVEDQMAWTERFSLTGKTALVTGASKGIGFKICEVLADAGADIAAVARDRSGLEEVADAVRKLGRRCAIIEADLADAKACITAAKAAQDAFGAIDILVNNAAVALTAGLFDIAVEDFDLSMAVNLRAPMLLAKALAPGMISRKSGKIINISSQAGVIGIKDHIVYCATKGGLNTMTKAMMAELAEHNIQVNAICPTVILTPMGTKVWGEPAKGQPMLDKTPAGRFGQPIEVADLALFLASSASDLVNGECVLIDGGFSSV
jgi:NAD(P)-dependent dehydrogenase (short-subunit alcohol dehydrogenase family)